MIRQANTESSGGSYRGARGLPKELVAYWNRFSRPEKTAKYSPVAFDTWWLDEAKDRALQGKQAQ